MEKIERKKIAIFLEELILLSIENKDYDLSESQKRSTFEDCFCRTYEHYDFDINIYKYILNKVKKNEFENYSSLYGFVEKCEREYSGLFGETATIDAFGDIIECDTEIFRSMKIPTLVDSL